MKIDDVEEDGTPGPLEGLVVEASASFAPGVSLSGRRGATFRPDGTGYGIPNLNVGGSVE